MISDRDLLREYSERRSESAFAELVSRHVDFVYGAALRQLGGDVHRAEDVTQIVFTDLARKAASLSTRATLLGWLHISVHHASAQLRRGEQRRKVREQEAYHMHHQEETSAPPAEWERLLPVLDTVIRELDEADREAVLLRFFEQRPFAEIAAVLEVGEDAARKRVTRALDKLHALLTRRGITSSAVALGTLLGSQTAVSAPAGLAAAVTSAALTVGATGSGIGMTASLMKFMSTTKVVTLTGSAVLLLALGATVYQTRALAVIGRERDDLRAQYVVADQRVQQLQRDLAAAQSAHAVPDSTKTSAPKPVASGPGQNGDPLDYILDHPELHAAYVQQQIRRVESLFSAFSRGLPPEKQAAFLQWARAGVETNFDLTLALHAQGADANRQSGEIPSAQLRTMAQEKEKARNAKLSEALGDDLYQQWREYSQTTPEHTLLEQLAGKLYAGSTPLTPEQSEQLVQVLAANRYSPRSNLVGGIALSPQTYTDAWKLGSQLGTPQGSLPITDAALAEAQAILKPAQLDALRDLQATQISLMQLTSSSSSKPATSPTR
jgi:RNA polymerase sigma factor (sigma-70 family)